MPRIGARMVALASSSSARSTAARDWATLASASATLGARRRAAFGRCAGGSRPDRGRPALRRAPGATSFSALSDLARSNARRAKATSGASASMSFFFSAPPRRRSGRRSPPAGWRAPRAGGPAASPCRARRGPGPARSRDRRRPTALDDAVGLRLDLDLGDRLDLAGQHSLIVALRTIIRRP